MPTAEQIQTAVKAYVAAIESRDREGWLDGFAPDATLVDPVPAPPAVGREAIAGVWDTMAAAADRFTMEIHDTHVGGDQAAVVFTLTVAAEGGGGMAFDGVEIFTVDGEGRITEARSYWDPARMRRIEAG
jgi:steroid delta-isomerase